MNWGHFFRLLFFIFNYLLYFSWFLFISFPFFYFSPTTFSGTHLPRTVCTGSYALGAVVVVAVFIVPKIEFRDNSLKNYLTLYAKRKE